MDRGMYTSASGGLLGLRRLQILSNNLANVSTVGFKAQRLVAREQSFEETLASTLPNVPASAKGDFQRVPAAIHLNTVTDFSPGPIQTTGNPLDVALRKPNQFFVVNTPEGEVYTRAGNFTLNAEGNLVTQDGFAVLGDGGALTVEGGKASIVADGSLVVGGEAVGRLRVVEIEDLTKLTHLEGVRFKLEGGGQPQTVEADVVPNSVEMPNVSVVEAMVDMISANKGFEAYTKTLRTIDELNDVAIRNARTMG